MHPRTARTVLLLLALLPGLPGVALARSLQEGGPAAAPPEEPEVEPTAEPAAETQEERPALPQPGTVEEGVAVDLGDLKAGLEAATPEERQAALGTWMGLVRDQQAAFLAARDADEGSAAHQGAEKLGADRDALLARAEVVLAAVADAGGSVDRARATIATIREREADELDRISTVPADPSRAQDLDLEMLRAQLRPLTREQVGEQLEQWLALLQKKCLVVRKVEVAALQSEDAREIEDYNARAVELRGERGRLIERVRVVIASLKAKGGDVDAAKDYVDSVVVAPPITGWRAAMTTARAWITNPDGGIALGKRIVFALLTVLVFWLLASLFGRVAERALRSVRKASGLLREFLVSSVRKGTLFLGVLIALGRMGLDLGPLLAAIGAAGLVIGFALQGTLSNFASGLMIMVYRPFDVGDVVSVAGTSGKVEGMTLVTTLVRTFDNQSVYIPNNKVWGDVITNVTANTTRRVDMTFGIGYGDDVQRAKEVLLEVLSAHEKVLEDPAPVVRVHELADSSVNFIARPWVRTEDYWTVYWDLTQAVKERFDAEGITIPFPQRDLHVHGPAGEGIAWLRPAERRTDAEDLVDLPTGRPDGA